MASRIARRALMPAAACASAFVALQVLKRQDQVPLWLPATVWMPLAQVHAEGSTKLPIYDPPSKDYEDVKIPPNDLELAIRRARHAFSRSVDAVENSLHSVVSSWIAIERRAAAAVNKVRGTDETFLPAAAYIAVASFTGSFLVRNRGLFVRAIVPPTFFLASSAILLPGTSANLWQAGFRHLPPETQEEFLRVRAQADSAVSGAVTTVAQWQRKARELATGLRANSAEGSARTAAAESAREGAQSVGAALSTLVSAVTGGSASQSSDGAPAAQESPKPSTGEAVARVEQMYTTRGDPGVRQVIEADRKESGEHH